MQQRKILSIVVMMYVENIVFLRQTGMIVIEYRHHIACNIVANVCTFDTDNILSHLIKYFIHTTITTQTIDCIITIAMKCLIFNKFGIF